MPDADALSDPPSEFFAVRREFVPDASLSPTGYEILLEVVTECDVDRVVEVPFRFSDRDRGESNEGHLPGSNRVDFDARVRVVATQRLEEVRTAGWLLAGRQACSWARWTHSAARSSLTPAMSATSLALVRERSLCVRMPESASRSE